jgi:hypothetical protein
MFISVSNYYCKNTDKVMNYGITIYEKNICTYVQKSIFVHMFTSVNLVLRTVTKLNLTELQFCSTK